MKNWGFHKNYNFFITRNQNGKKNNKKNKIVNLKLVDQICSLAYIIKPIFIKYENFWNVKFWIYFLFLHNWNVSFFFSNVDSNKFKFMMTL